LGKKDQKGGVDQKEKEKRTRGRKIGPKHKEGIGWGKRDKKGKRKEHKGIKLKKILCKKPFEKIGGKGK